MSKSPALLRALARTSSALSRCRHLHSAPSTRNSPSPSTSTINAAEIAHFSRLASLWWDARGEFAMLHRMNPLRVRFVADKLAECEDGLRGKEVLDVGCGGGLLSESLARLGARTLGIDASDTNIAIATRHASADPALRERLEYRAAPAEDLVQEQQRFDVVCSMEVLEHVDNPRAFLASCAELVKPGGHLFLSTIARTPLSYLLTILMAERVLRMVAPGTHTHAKYVDPHELVDFFREHTTPDGRPWIRSGTRAETETRGMVYVPWTGSWVLALRGGGLGGIGEACNYLFWVRKPA